MCYWNNGTEIHVKICYSQKRKSVFKFYTVVNKLIIFLNL